MLSLLSRRRFLGMVPLASASALLAAMPSPAHTSDTQSRSRPAPLVKRRIPKSGEELPAVGLGTWQAFDIAGNARALAQAKQALEMFSAYGGTLIDSSPMYGASESVVGDLASELGLHKRLFLATKVWTSGREAGIRQMESSMAKMRSSLKGPLDLMQVHNLVDVDTHLATLAEWKKAGRVRYVGVTHYSAGAHAAIEAQIRRNAATTANSLDFVQINYSIAEPQAAERVLPAAAEAGVAVIINRPFAEGAMLERARGKPLPGWAAEIGTESWAQFFLKWIIAHPAVTCAIPGTRNPKYVEDNLRAATGALPDEAMRRRMAAYFNAL